MAESTVLDLEAFEFDTPAGRFMCSGKITFRMGRPVERDGRILAALYVVDTDLTAHKVGEQG